MELRHLRSFVAASELPSFTRAAETLKLTQAGVSQHIGALEKDLDTVLFTRVGRTMRLTEEGQRLYDYARKILDLVDEVRTQIGAAPATVGGTLRLAASTVPAEWLLPEVLAEFRRQYPEIRESVTVSDSAAATEAVERGLADVGLVGELPRSSNLQTTPIASDELVLVVPRGHRMSQAKHATIDALRQERLIVREPGSGSRRCVDQALEAAGVAPGELSVAMEVNSNESIRAAISRGVGVAFLSRHALVDEGTESDLVSVRLKGFRAQRQLYVITDPRRIPSPQVRKFLSLLEDSKRKIAPTETK